MLRMKIFPVKVVAPLSGYGSGNYAGDSPGKSIIRNVPWARVIIVDLFNGLSSSSCGRRFLRRRCGYRRLSVSACRRCRGRVASLLGRRYVTRYGLRDNCGLGIGRIGLAIRLSVWLVIKLTVSLAINLTIGLTIRLRCWDVTRHLSAILIASAIATAPLNPCLGSWYRRRGCTNEGCIAAR